MGWGGSRGAVTTSSYLSPNRIRVEARLCPCNGPKLIVTLKVDILKMNRTLEYSRAVRTRDVK
jgi:hypothetical protein